MPATMTDLYAELQSGRRPISEAYRAKQLHPVPPSDVVVRERFLLERCTGEVVLDIGASGPMHDAIAQVAAKCYGIDRQDGPGVTGIDLDDYHAALPIYPDVTRVICGEVLEHLSNPGWFLRRLREAYRCQTIITVPNAHSVRGLKWLAEGIENCNRDHCAWYSYRTIKTLLERHGYEIQSLHWYNGQPRVAEGLIVVTE